MKLGSGEREELAGWEEGHWGKRKMGTRPAFGAACGQLINSFIWQRESYTCLQWQISKRKLLVELCAVVGPRSGVGGPFRNLPINGNQAGTLEERGSE